MTDTAFSWLHKLLKRLDKSNINILQQQSFTSGIRMLQVDPGNWKPLCQHLQLKSCRFAGLWASFVDSKIEVNACFERNGDFLICRTHVGTDAPSLTSIGSLYSAAQRFERHCHDLLGVTFKESIDSRRWTRHQAWAEDEFPLRPDFNIERMQKATAGDSDYPFQKIGGSAVYEIPVGPVHAGIIEPGHFRFQAVGETVLNLEERFGYTHKGVEKIAEGRDPEGLARLAGRVSGDSTVAHSWAACQAMERAVNIEVPLRGQFIRGLLCERERIANHLGDIGAICNDVGFAFAQMQFSRLREVWLRRNLELFNHRLLMDQILPGGCRVDIDDNSIESLRTELHELKSEAFHLLTIIEKNQSLRDRVIETGFLSKEKALQLGCLGYVARASGIDFDLRRDAPYPPYDQISVEKTVLNEGDVAARIIQRARELYASLTAQQQLLDKLPHGPIITEWKTPPAHSEGIGLVEGWRGEVLCHVRFDANGTVSRFFPRDPSWLNWPALEVLIHNNIVPDFPVCNKSLNASYSGQDL